MKNKILSLQEQIAQLQAAIDKIDEQIQAEYNLIFDDCPELQAAIAQIQNYENTRPMLSEYGDSVDHWVRFDLSRFADCQEYLAEYLADHDMRPDFDNGCLIMRGGPELLINDDGDVYDQESGKFIVESDQYETEAERNSLIEAWMQQHGYFPAVYYSDRYCNLTLVNTQQK